jgi:glutamate--cysteine ligase
MAATAPLRGTPEELWLRAARFGLEDPQLATAARKCFAAADEALGRLGAPAEVRDAVAAFTNRYVLPGRCPADDLLDEVRGAESPAHVIRYLHDIRLPDVNLATVNEKEQR